MRGRAKPSPARWRRFSASSPSLPRKGFERVATEKLSSRPAAEYGGREHASSDGLGLRMIRAAMDESFPGVVVTKAAGVIDYVNRSPDHILAVDKDGLITSVHWTIPGITVDGEVGRTVYDFVREE